MRVISNQTLLCLALSLKVEANFLQTLFSFGNNGIEEQEDRNLGWNFGDLVLEDDRFFGSYDPDEIPDDKEESGDRIDYLRDGDVCIGNDGSLSRDNCLEPPDCSMSNDLVGEAMLCINRATQPGSTTDWYVLAMKCIPVWENCDKCFCGYMKRSYAEDGFCRWDDSSANDDRVEYDCDDRTKAEMMGYTFTYGESIVADNDGPVAKGGKDEKEAKGGKGDKENEDEDWEEDGDWEEDEDDDDDERIRQRRHLNGKVSKGAGVRRRR